MRNSCYLAAVMLFASPLSGMADEPRLPQFSAHPASGIYSGSVAQRKLKTKKDREFSTQLKEASRRPVNFAGHFVLATWGCGTDCVMGAILDARSGKVRWLPFTICCSNDNAVPVDFRPDSTLIVFHGMKNERQPVGNYYYVYERDKLTLLAAQARN